LAESQQTVIDREFLSYGGRNFSISRCIVSSLFSCGIRCQTIRRTNRLIRRLSLSIAAHVD